MSFFAHFVGFSFKVLVRGLFVAFMPLNRLISRFLLPIFLFVVVLFPGKIQIVTSFPCNIRYIGFLVVYLDFNTAQ